MFTVDQIMELRPCDDYPRARVVELFAGRNALTAQDVAALSIPLTDRMWALRRSLDATALRLSAVDCAERVVHLCKDERSRAAIMTARRFALGIATVEELRTASASAAASYAAAYASADAADAAASYAAAASAYADAADAAAYAYEREWQLARLVEWHTRRDELIAEHRAVASAA